jgi:hypothetical protein
MTIIYFPSCSYDITVWGTGERSMEMELTVVLAVAFSSTEENVITS